MGKATKEKLNKLHDMQATYLMELIESGEQLSSGELAAINSFLKTNEVTADVVESEALGGLAFSINNILEEHKQEKEA